MTIPEILEPRVMAAVANYVSPNDTSREVQARLLRAADAVAAELDLDSIARDAQGVTGREPGLRLQAMERLTAQIGRAILLAEIRRTTGQLTEENSTWISSHITAHSNRSFRSKAIWRIAADIGTAHDRTLHEHALKSALTGTTIEPAPGAEPHQNPRPGMEDQMIDPSKIRELVQALTAFNPANLPTRLRGDEDQKIYLESIAQGVSLSRHFDDENKAALWVATVAGLMLLEGNFNPTDQRFFPQLQKLVSELSGSAIESGQVEINGYGRHMFAPEVGATQRIAIYGKTFDILRDMSGDKNPVFLQSYAHAGRRMSDLYDEHQGKEDLMRPMVRSAYDNHVSDLAVGGSGGGGGGGLANVDLPPLNDPSGYNDEIEPENVRAVSTIYVTYQLEFGLKAAARILDLFVAGLLPISASDGSARELDNLYWDQEDMLDEASRRSVYSRVLGAPGGEVAFDIQPNSEFNTLLMRVVSAVSEFEREQSALTHFDNAARGRRFQSTSPEFVRKAIRDFAANVSLRGWAGTAFTAERMAKQVKRVMRVLNLASVRNAFGVTTPWQVIERVSQREFGITVNTVLHRTLAVETQTIMKIIADHHTVWSSGTSGKPLFAANRNDDADIDYDTTQRLLIACQHFRAVTGVGDALLNEYSAPVETSAQPSLPDMASFGGGTGGMPGIDMGGIAQLRQMVGSGQAPSLEQLRALLPGF